MRFWKRYRCTTPDRLPDHATPLSRRVFLGSSALGFWGLGAVADTPHHRTLTQSADYTYELNRSEEEWRARLSDDEFAVLRGGATEVPRSSFLWNETRDGTYHCKGCDLLAYVSKWKVPLNKGWAFFSHAETNAVLTGIDGAVPQYGNAMGSGDVAITEVHCRRCASHLGHLLIVERQQVHCINGTALNFEPATA